MKQIGSSIGILELLFFYTVGVLATQPRVTLRDQYNNVCTNGPSATANNSGVVITTAALRFTTGAISVDSELFSVTTQL